MSETPTGPSVAIGRDLPSRLEVVTVARPAVRTSVLATGAA